VIADLSVHHVEGFILEQAKSQRVNRRAVAALRELK
jgi:hypothetical protein